MSCKYVVREQEVVIDQLEGVIAVMPESRIETSVEISRAFGRAIRRPLDGTDADDWFAMEMAGWVFVHPRLEVVEALKSGRHIEGAIAFQRVFRRDDGAMLLGLDQLCVQLKVRLPEHEALEKLREVGLEFVNKLTFAPNLYTVRVPHGPRDIFQVSRDLSRDESSFSFVEPEFIEHITARAPHFSRGPDYSKQWQLNDPVSGIRAEGAWDHSRGNGIRLAVVDNGIQIDHPDLESALEPESGYFQKCSASRSAKFVLGEAGFPITDHGTFCAGMAVARADNRLGGCGIANLTRLVAVACLTDQVGKQTTLARAIAYAADPSREGVGSRGSRGADIISCSLGRQNNTWPMTQCLQKAIDFAVTKGRNNLGVPVFWAVSNTDGNLAGDEVCAYENTIAVGSSTPINSASADMPSGGALDFLAPGVQVFSTAYETTYKFSTGTSYAAALAAGVGALVLSRWPNLRWDQVRDKIRNSCDKIDSGPYVPHPGGRNDKCGWGRINAERAVQ